MSRLVLAVLILFAVLFGLRMTNSSFFSRNVANRLDSGAPATRSTGFSTATTGTATTGTTTTGKGSSQSLSTTPLPPNQQSEDNPPPNVIRSW